VRIWPARGAAQPYHDHLVVSTSGCTGRPAIFVYSRAEMAEAVAGLMRALAVLGAGPGTRVVGVGAPSAVSLSHHLISGLRSGRPSDVLSTPAGARVPVHAMILRAPFAAFPDVVQYQIVQDHAGLLVSVVLRPDAEPDQPARVREALAGRLDAAGVLPPPITVIVVPGIARENGPLPKHAVVKSLLPGPGDQ
jgi:hypothetical protein